MKEIKKERKASKVLGILSICLFFLNWVAMILAIIGLCIKKSEENRGRDIALNVVGLVLSTLTLFWVLSIMGV